LTLDRYRDYYGTNSVNQSYKLKRDQLVASFIVDNSGNVAKQSFNVYGGDGFTVNNLMHNSSSVGDIGLGLYFEYSMLDEEDVLHYPIYTMGDNVTFTIVNPNLTSFTPVEETYTLKDYSLHTFLGSNFASTGGPLKFNSSRLKLNNNYYDNNSARYSVTLVSGSTEVRFIQDYLGNPTEISNSDWNNQDVLASGNYVELVDGGLTLNSFNISRLENTVALLSTSYLVLVPPYLKFVQRGSFVQETDLPYNPATNAEDNTVVSYLPVSTTKEYFPFATRSFTYFDGSTATVTFDPAHTNNVEIFNNNNRSDEYTSIYSDTPNSDIRSFYVEGNYYVINLEKKTFEINSKINGEVGRNMIGIKDKINIDDRQTTFTLKLVADPINKIFSYFVDDKEIQGFHKIPTNPTSSFKNLNIGFKFRTVKANESINLKKIEIKLL
jgi:hypothetical protein